MAREREILVGKLAIGRGLLARDAAVRCFAAARNEPFWEVAVREGILARAQADDLVRTVDGGTLVCRGTCGAHYRLSATPPEQTARCPACGGPLYVAAYAVTKDTVRSSDGEMQEAIASGRREASARVQPVNGRANETASEFSEAPPTRVAPRDGALPTFGGDSLPSAIPIPSPAVPVAPRRPEAPAKLPAPSGEPGFVPFTIAGYDVLATIGRGGMGCVFRARHRTLDRLVAIKVLMNATEDQRARFDREIKATAALDHKNIVRILVGGVVQEDGEHTGRPFFVMEHVVGRDLAHWAHEQPRSPAACAAMVATLCDAMAYAHDKGIIHRDLKPQNVLVTADGDVPKICDFGLARIAESNLTRTGDIMGTPQYMPPEQILGDRTKIGPHTDVYGMGAVFYHLLTGAPPFHSKNILALTTMVVRDKPVPPRQKNPAVPEALELLVQKALEKDPARRFRTASEMGRAIRSLRLK